MRGFDFLLFQEWCRMVLSYLNILLSQNKLSRSFSIIFLKLIANIQKAIKHNTTCVLTVCILGNTCQARCKPGFQESGSRTFTCSQEGKWVGNLTCKGIGIAASQCLFKTYLLSCIQGQSLYLFYSTFVSLIVPIFNVFTKVSFLNSFFIFIKYTRTIIACVFDSHYYSKSQNFGFLVF